MTNIIDLGMQNNLNNMTQPRNGGEETEKPGDGLNEIETRLLSAVSETHTLSQENRN
ncbi:hypothetical protein [Caballeronia mineralivorans]|uniref:hypothetical protein n=1 Tax=Caballeronia mineralivorans TaxID=2010198 RepID=UPI001364B45F|nr:hypothetical protein [Caballeronia mineralivorans]